MCFLPFCPPIHRSFAFVVDDSSPASAVPEKPQPATVALLQLLLPDQAQGPRQLQLQLSGRTAMDAKVRPKVLINNEHC